MVKKNNSFLNPENSTTILLLFLFISLTSIFKENIQDIPIPTEIIEKKKNRKIFKQNRKEWMENMHRAAPGVDWRLVNENTRKNKFIAKTLKRKNSLPNIQNLTFDPNRRYLSDGVGA